MLWNSFFKQVRVVYKFFNGVGDGDGSLEDQTWDLALEKGLFNPRKAKASMKKEVEVLCSRALNWPDSSVPNFYLIPCLLSYLHHMLHTGSATAYGR